MAESGGGGGKSTPKKTYKTVPVKYVGNKRAQQYSKPSTGEMSGMDYQIIVDSKYGKSSKEALMMRQARLEQAVKNAPYDREKGRR